MEVLETMMIGILKNFVKILQRSYICKNYLKEYMSQRPSIIRTFRDVDMNYSATILICHTLSILINRADYFKMSKSDLTTKTRKEEDRNL
uniref:Uncharacterized protein n=1 Tax=Onchocerca volvulus TaxID=6282 RepID=A0A8R1U1A4_ONCVO